ncbi:hypothetical protein [Amycolatopsis sp. GA6-003]|uniref:hypothetical protein n=1 Tax=Amycolatopsis sp. GA6-003 TaxID=2652444 RepID=UPI003917595C
MSAEKTDTGSVELSNHSSAEPKENAVEQATAATALQGDDQQARVPSRRTGDLDEKLVELARKADADHWRRCGRPISAETLRKELRGAAQTSRALVAVVRPKNAPVSGNNPELEVA